MTVFKTHLGVAGRTARDAPRKSDFPALSDSSMIVSADSRIEPRTYGGVSMKERSTTLGISLTVGPDADAEQVADATLQLRRELLDLDVDAVELPRAGEPPPGTRAVELAALGALVVTVGQSQLLTAVVAAVRAWLAGSQHRSIKLELGGDVLELTRLPSKEQRRLTDEWLRRHESR